MENINNIIECINNSNSFEDLKKLNILPEPDFDDGYYFVSYSHKDYKKVLIDIINYKENGIKIWYDRGLEVGKSWIEDVCRKIDSFNCKGVIAYISTNFLASSACAREINQTKESNKSFIIVDIDGSTDKENVECDYVLEYNVDILEKAEKIKLLPKPEIFEFAIDKARYIGKFAKLVKVNDKNIEIAKIPEYYFDGKRKYHVRMIADNAFLNCVNLKEVYLPNGWTMVVTDAFSNCYSLKKVIVGKPFKLFKMIYVGSFHSCFTNCLALKDLSFLSFNTNTNKGMGYIICTSSFRNCTSLENIVITNPFICTTGAFMDCSGLKKVEFNNSSNNLDMYLFANCRMLEEVTFKNVKQMGLVGEYAFSGCEKLKKIDLPDSISKIQDYAFYRMKSFEEIHMPINLTYLALNAFSECEKIKKLELPGKVKRIKIDESNIFEEVIIKTKKIVFVDGYGEVEVSLKNVFPKLKALYCVKDAEFDFSELVKTESDIEGFDKYIVEEKYE